MERQELSQICARYNLINEENWKLLHSGKRKHLKNSQRMNGNQFVMGVENAAFFDWKEMQVSILQQMSYVSCLMNQPVSVRTIHKDNF